MTDRELLEAAAKAAGIAIDKSYGDKTGFDVCGNVVLDWHNGVTWSPLTDDGDAFKLAVKLKIDIAFENWSDGDWVYVYGHEAGAERLGNDPYAATRRAIVRAAAKIGRSKE